MIAFGIYVFVDYLLMLRETT